MNAEEMNAAVTHGLLDTGNDIVTHLSSGVSANGTVSHLVRGSDPAPVGLVLNVKTWPNDNEIPEIHSLFVPRSALTAIDFVASPE